LQKVKSQLQNLSSANTGKITENNK